VNTDELEAATYQARRRVLEIQAKLHRWARDDPHRRFDDVFNLVADPAFLLVAWDRVRHNKGAKTAGVDGHSAYYVQAVLGVEEFCDRLRTVLKDRSFRPVPVRERMIPKAGGKQRRLPRLSRLAHPTPPQAGNQPVLRLYLPVTQSPQVRDDQGEDHLPAERQPANASPDAQAQPSASRLVRLLSPRRVQRHLRLPGPLHLGPGPAMGPTQTPPDHGESHPPPLLQRRMVADHVGHRPVQPGQHAHHALPIPGNSHTDPMADHGMRTTPTTRNLWRARCLVTGTPGSGGDSGKPTGRKHRQGALSSRPHTDRLVGPPHLICRRRSPQRVGEAGTAASPGQRRVDRRRR
jgi:hypothetical protein